MGMIDIGGYSLFIDCAGEGNPPVVLEIGGGGTAEDWITVQTEIARFTQVCRYDRAGSGKSERSLLPISPERLAGELRTLLTRAEVAVPRILVGQSIGGLIMQVYAHLFPKDVAGIVLVDAVHPDLDFRMAEIVTPEQSADDYAHRPAAADYARVRAMGPLPDVPLLVLSAAQNQRVPPGWPAEAMGRLRTELQEDLVTFAPRSTRVIVDCGHHIHLERPDAVVEAIQRVIEAVRVNGIL